MAMFWQWLVVSIVIGLAAVYLVRATWKTWFAAKGSCGGGCSCAGKSPSDAAAKQAATFIPVEDLRLLKRPKNFSQ